MFVLNLWWTELSYCVWWLIMTFEGRFSLAERYTERQWSDSSWRNKWRWFFKVGWLASTVADESFCKQPSCQVRLTPGNQYLTLPHLTTAFTLIHRFTVKYRLQTAAAEAKWRFFFFFPFQYTWPPLCWIKASHSIVGGMVTNGNPAFRSFVRMWRRKRTTPRFLYTCVRVHIQKHLYSLKIKQEILHSEIWLWVNKAQMLKIKDKK